MNTENKKLTVAIAGLGSRGNAYASCFALMKDKVEIVAAADLIEDKRNRFAAQYDLKPEQMYCSAEEMLEKEKLADVMCICTLDRQHYCLAIPALKKGYHLLLEKPASPDPRECAEIAKTANELDRQVVVCHVLRYTPYYQKLREVVRSGVIGDVVSIQANEETVYWHMAHSFVRGNWRNSDTTSPLLLQKCCHDMDILLWLTGKHCLTVSSFGSLALFKPENAPEGAPERCSENCPAYGNCPYSIRFYLDRADKGMFGWPLDVVEPEPSAEKMRETLKTSPYGRCVYHCDNNVVDHQVVNLLLEDGVTVSFNVCAFNTAGERRTHIMGTLGEIKASSVDSKIELTVFGKEPQMIDAHGETDSFGHGGGDYGIARDLISLFDESGETKKQALTSINDSIESHLVCLAAEKSRLNGGEAINIADYRKSL